MYAARNFIFFIVKLLQHL